MDIDDFRFFVYDFSVDLQAELSNVLYAYFTKPLRSPGYLEIAIPLSDVYEPADDHCVEVNDDFSDSGLRWAGVFISETLRVNEGGAQVRVLRWAGLTHILYNVINAFRAGTSGRSYFPGANGAAAILNNVLAFNLILGTVATHSRIADSPYQDFGSQTEGSNSTLLTDYRCAYRVIHEIVTELCQLTGMDFGYERIANQFYIKYWQNGRGSNRNVSLITYDHLVPEDTQVQEAERRHVAVVAGQGKESERAVEVRTSSEYSATLHNGRELFVDARDLTTATELQERGDIQLEKEFRKREQRFRLVLSPAVRIDDNIQLGDTLKVDGQDKRVVGIEYSIRNTAEVHVRLEDA